MSTLQKPIDRTCEFTQTPARSPHFAWTINWTDDNSVYTKLPMSYDISEHSGYVINIKELIKGFPELESHLEDDSDTLEDMIKSLLIENVYADLDVDSIELYGNWTGDEARHYGEWLGLNEGKVYLCFSEEQLINVLRVDGRTTKTKSTSFVKLEEFFVKNGIPLDSLFHNTWKMGG